VNGTVIQHLRTSAFTIEETFPINIPAHGQVTLTVDYYPGSINTGLIKDVLTINSDINTTSLVQRIAQQIKLTGRKTDDTPPVPSILLADKENVSLDTVIYINFSEPVRKPDNSEFTYSNVDPVVIFRKKDVNGESVPFDAVISTDKNIITITPVTKLDHTQTYYVAITKDYEDYSNNNGSALSATFKTIDLTPPVVTITPADGGININPEAPLTIQFNEPVRNPDNSELTNSNLIPLTTLKTSNASGDNVPFSATINTAKALITIVPELLASNTTYYISLGTELEDYNNNPPSPASSTFTTGIVSGFEVSHENVPRIYPNPGNGLFTIEFSSQILKRIRVTDLSGKTILVKENLSGGYYQLDLRNIQEGFYFLFIESTVPQTNHILKLIKQNDGR
jgi:hypothetical protein